VSDPVLQAALTAYDAGLCTIRPKADGSKAPLPVPNHGRVINQATGKRALGWEAYQSKRPSRFTVEAWFHEYPGLGLVTGEVSGHLQMLELEGRMMADPVRRERFTEALDRHGAREVWRRMTAGYRESTPSGGIHTMTRVPDHVAGNTVLARCLTDEGIRPLIETRGQGGFVVVAPSNGTTHPTGGSWTLESGGFAEIATITVEEWAAVLGAARDCNEVESPEAAIPPPRRLTDPKPWSGGQVGPSWMDATVGHLEATEGVLGILSRHGWRVDRTTAEMMYVAHPGHPEGHMAQIKRENGRLLNYSTSVPFDAWPTSRGDPPRRVPTRSYDAADCLAVYEFGGDREAALRSVAETTGIYSTWTTERGEEVKAAAGSGSTQSEEEEEEAAAAGSGSTGTTKEEKEEEVAWEKPTLLRVQSDLPEFPDGVLPAWLGAYVRAVAAATQTPVDLAGCMAISALGVAAGGKALVGVRSGWEEPTNFWTVSALAPGARKSAVVALITAPFFIYQRDRKAVVEVEIVEKTALKKAAEASLAQLIKDQAKAADQDDATKKKNAEEIAAQAALVAAIEVPVYPRLLADDATPEALASLMAEQGGRMGVLSPEGDVFDLMAGRYAKEPNLGIYLKGHSGDTYQLDRIGREPEFIERPALTLGLSVQPHVLREIGARKNFRGRGLLARFLYAIPDDKVGYRQVTDAPDIDARLTVTYRDRMTRLVETLAGWNDPMRLSLTAEARCELLTFAEGTEVGLRPDGDLGSAPILREWGSKLVGESVRVAALFHVAEHDEPHRTPIGANTVRAAIKLAPYWIAHAKAAFGLMGEDPAVMNAEAVLSWLHREELETFTKRDAFNAHRSRFPRAEDADPALGLLEAHGWIARQSEPKRAGAGRRPSPSYKVNPLPAESAQSAQSPTGSHSADTADSAGGGLT
jgi:replicative DNA helicase